jgi:hypothetical protein
MTPIVIAERRFNEVDQTRFANLSGDVNPVHVDGLAARRTLAGAPIVHGVHAFLWALESALLRDCEALSIGRLSVSFKRMIYLGDRVEVIVNPGDSGRRRVEALVAGRSAMAIEISPASSTDSTPKRGDAGELFAPTKPVSLTPSDIARCVGRIAFHCSPSEAARFFPAATTALGPGRVSALVSLSYLVGMVCPGLHSIFKGFRVASIADEGNLEPLRFQVTRMRSRLVTMLVRGGGWEGSLEALVRPEPQGQVDSQTLAQHIEPDEFEGARALVVGGSRGLGELVARSIAAGGGDVTVTYSVGEQDARLVQSEIQRHGGRCALARLDVRGDVEAYVRSIRMLPNQVYYMATPPIFSRQSERFDYERFDMFCKFYVKGFYDAYREICAKAQRIPSFFYPSSEAVQTRPKGMTEYAMAKAAGEMLCADLQASEKTGAVVVERLPRLPTDQTASLLEVETGDPIDILLPVIRRVNRARSD